MELMNYFFDFTFYAISIKILFVDPADLGEQKQIMDILTNETVKIKAYGMQLSCKFLVEHGVFVSKPIILFFIDWFFRQRISASRIS